MNPNDDSGWFYPSSNQPRHIAIAPFYLFLLTHLSIFHSMSVVLLNVNATQLQLFYFPLLLLTHSKCLFLYILQKNKSESPFPTLEFCPRSMCKIYAWSDKSRRANSNTNMSVSQSVSGWFSSQNYPKIAHIRMRTPTLYNKLGRKMRRDSGAQRLSNLGRDWGQSSTLLWEFQRYLKRGAWK